MKKLLVVLPLALLLCGCAALFSKSHLGSGTATAKSSTKSVTPEERSSHRVTETREYLVPVLMDEFVPATVDIPPLPLGTSLVRVTRIEETETAKTPGITEQLHEGTTVTPTMDVLGDIKDVKPPRVDLPSGVSATGGTQEAISQYLDFLPKNSIAFWAAMIGIGLTIVGVALVFIVKWPTGGWPLVGLGVILFLCGVTFESAVWIAYVIVGVLSIGGLIYLYLYLRTKTGAGVIVNAIQALPADVQRMVKDLVARLSHQERVEPAVNATVDKTKGTMTLEEKE